MELSKASSFESLLESIVSSEDGFQNLDIEELDDEEYGLPTSEDIPTLEDLISSDDNSKSAVEAASESSTLLEVKFLQGISQQIKSAEERSSTGAASTIALGNPGLIAIGTIHGHVLTFRDQKLLWVSTNGDAGAAVSSCFSENSTRLLIGFSQGMVIQYEIEHGKQLRTIQLGNFVWGVQQICWAGASAVALDTGGSVYKLKFSRPFGVRTIQSMRLFSGSKEEVIAMAAHSSRVAAFATSTRVVVVVGSKALATPLTGLDTQPPVLTFLKDTLIAARGNNMQWLQVDEAGGRIKLNCLRRSTVSQTVLWLGNLNGTLSWLGADEKLRLWPEADGFDLGTIRLVYTSAVSKGACDSTRSLSKCNVGGVACSVCCGRGVILGRDGVLTVRIRPPALRAKAHIARCRYALAAQTLLKCKDPECSAVVNELLDIIRENPSILKEHGVADAVVELCIQLQLAEPLWTILLKEGGFEAIGRAAAAGRLQESIAPHPPETSILLRSLSDDVAAQALRSLPLTSLDLHGEAEYARSTQRGLTLVTLLGRLLGLQPALEHLQNLTKFGCGGHCHLRDCFGSALLTASLEALSAPALADRSHALQTILSMRLIKTLLRHDAVATCISLRRTFSEPPFVGPLGKHNRESIVKEAIETATIPKVEFCSEIVEWVCSLIGAGNVNSELIDYVLPLLDASSDDAWINLSNCHRAPKEQLLESVKDRPRVRRHLLRSLGRASEALSESLKDEQLNHREIDECLTSLKNESGEMSKETLATLENRLSDFVKVKARSLALLLSSRAKHLLPLALNVCSKENEKEIIDTLIEEGAITNDVALIHLAYLMKNDKSLIVPFLNQCLNEISPKEALKILEKGGPAAARVICLEALGDIDGALKYALEAFSFTKSIDERIDLATRAVHLCERASKISLEEVANRLSDQLIDCGSINATSRSAFASLLAAAPLPLRATLAARTCADCKSAASLLRWTTEAINAVEGMRGVQSMELHDKLRRALRNSLRGQLLPAERESFCREPRSRCDIVNIDLNLNRTAPRPDFDLIT